MKKIGIIVAMEEEKKAIYDIMTDIKEIEIYNLKFQQGKINEKECILVQSGIGKVNAARTTQILIDNFEIEFIINVGVAGAISEELNIGDIFIAQSVVQHDFDITAFEHEKGFITGVGKLIDCDNQLIEKIRNQINNIKQKEYQVKSGIIASGDIFCTDENMKNKIKTKFNAYIIDMECAAIAQVAYLDNIPFISIRCISDIPNGENASVFDKNLEFTSKRCGEFLKILCLF